MYPQMSLEEVNLELTAQWKKLSPAEKREYDA